METIHVYQLDNLVIVSLYVRFRGAEDLSYLDDKRELISTPYTCVTWVCVA